MAAMFPAIYDAIDQNPNKSLRLKSATVLQPNLDTTWDRFSLTPLNPPGPVSCLLYHTDVMFRQGTLPLRKQIIREQILSLQERSEKELHGRRWPRKKVQDLLGAQCAVNTPQRSAILDDAVCELFAAQLILVDRSKRTVEFVPTDPRCWRSDRSIYLCDLDYRWVFECTERIGLATWLTQKEDESWQIGWPTADGKINDIKTAVLERNLVAHKAPGSEPSTKVKKDDWARTLGRVQTLEALRGMEFAAV